ncbi:aspartyl protease family A01B [Achlya hypogyna]|uniref:Aspartyl protease family A01B n=1 Tax=Achlya hypogyna TaxID=1202772 RepID=A0A1V9Z142_ACHHY|nr:aspartyl protease family A01B [Achlya hypogyna]
MYVDGSGWTAAMVNDIGYIGQMSKEPSEEAMLHNGARFHVATQVTAAGALANGPESGVIGFSKAPTTFLAALVADQKISRNAFSLCLAAQGGTIVLGGSDQNLHLPSATTAVSPMVPKANKYALSLVDIRIGPQSISSVWFPTSTVLVDSGSTLSYLPPGVVVSFVQAFKQATGVDYVDSTLYSRDKVLAWPTITLEFAGSAPETKVTLELPPTKYMYETSSGQFIPGLRTRTPTAGVVGANAMVDIDILFDLDRNEIAFTPANCSHTSATSKTPDQPVDKLKLE